MDFRSECVRDLVVVRPEEYKPGKIALPDWQRKLRGFVVAVGPGRPNRNGIGLAPMSCEVGDYVLFGAAAGMESVYDGVPIRVMRDGDVDAVLKSAADFSAERDTLVQHWVNAG